VYQIFIFLVVNARLFYGVTNSFQKGCLASIGSSDYENTKMTIFFTNFEGGDEVGPDGT
jgi:hypothetical protein